MSINSITNSYGNIYVPRTQYPRYDKRLVFSGANSVFIDNPQTKKKEDNSKGWAIGAGLGALASVGIYIATRGKAGKCEVVQLAPHIEFQPAKTFEDALKFGKENLGIKSYKGFEAKDLDILNWLNEGLVNTSNKMKGKLKSPRTIWNVDGEILGNNCAAMISNQEGKSAKYNGYFVVNKDVYGKIDTTIKEGLKNIEGYIKMGKDGNGKLHAARGLSDCKDLMKKIYKYQKGEMTKFNDKVDLYEDMRNFTEEYNRLYKFPDARFKKFLKDKEAVEILKKNNLETDINVINKMTAQEKTDLMIDYVKALGPKLHIVHDKNSNPFSAIYHEMGHLQDEVNRCQALGKFEGKPESEYPKELREWLNDTDAINTASKISDYATTGPAEFIAETFARMVQGKEIPKEVTRLYEKMGGPCIPA